MPEIVEVRKYVAFIRKHTHNNMVKEINIINGRYKKHGPFEGYKKYVKDLPLKIKEVNSKGKFIYFIFENDTVLFNTLGLSGGWVYSKTSLNSQPGFVHPKIGEFLNTNDVEKYHATSLKHCNVEFKLNEGYLYFFDTLSYGTMKLTTMEDLEKKLGKIGPDLLHLDTTLDIFSQQLKTKKNLGKKIGIVLMDQKTISGIGNYLRADCLWLAKISPHRLIKSMDDMEIKELYHSIQKLIWSDYDYKYAIKNKIIDKKFKRPSDYNRDFYIYWEEEDIHGNKVKTEELYEGSQKRSIFWVPSYQK
jgi:formamidopyrimidine-DNA glycosylase